MLPFLYSLPLLPPSRKLARPFPASVTYKEVSTGNILTHAVASAPGALTYEAGGRTYAVADNAAGALIGNLPGTVTAAPRSTVVIYSSGLAAAQAGVNTPTHLDLTSITQVTIGGKRANVDFSGLISPGLFQINAVVPKSRMAISPL